MRRLLAPLALSLALGACATTDVSRAPVQVTRFNLGQPIAPGTITPDPGIMSLEASTYRNAVERELNRLGFQNATAGTTSRYVYAANVTSEPREVSRRSPVSVGIGGGTGGYGSGVGIGIGTSFGLGGGRGQVFVTRLSVQLRERGGSTVWEGRAETETAGSADPALVAGRLADALFRDFPGESGRTITVR